MKLLVPVRSFQVHGNPIQFWKTIENQKVYLDWVAKELSLKTLQDWYYVKKEDIEQRGGFMLLKEYKRSLRNVLLKVYPEHNWLPWKFGPVEQKYWTKENQRMFFDSIASEIGIRNLDDWYNIKTSTIVEKGGGTILNYYYGDSLSQALITLYPNHEFLLWKFNKVPSTFWKNLDNQRKFFDWVAKQLHLKKPDDWYQVSPKEINKMGGSTIMGMYSGSLYKALQSIYQDVEWYPWKFKRTPDGFWKDIQNQRFYFDWIAKQLLITDFEQWYQFKISDLRKKSSFFICFIKNIWRISSSSIDENISRSKMENLELSKNSSRIFEGRE